MTEYRAAMIDENTNIVFNVVVLDTEVPFSVEGYYFIASDTANIGDIYDPVTETFTPPEE